MPRLISYGPCLVRSRHVPCLVARHEGTGSSAGASSPQASPPPAFLHAGRKPRPPQQLGRSFVLASSWHTFSGTQSALLSDLNSIDLVRAKKPPSVPATSQLIPFALSIFFVDHRSWLWTTPLVVLVHSSLYDTLAESPVLCLSKCTSRGVREFQALEMNIVAKTVLDGPCARLSLHHGIDGIHILWGCIVRETYLMICSRLTGTDWPRAIIGSGAVTCQRLSIAIMMRTSFTILPKEPLQHRLQKPSCCFPTYSGSQCFNTRHLKPTRDCTFPNRIYKNGLTANVRIRPSLRHVSSR